MVVATLIFASGALFENPLAFYLISFFARALQGAADAFILVAVPSVIAIEWPDQNEVYQGYAGISMGLGLMLGPVLAVFIMKFVNYLWTLFIFAVLVGILSFGATFFIPNRIDTLMDGAKE